MIIDVIWTKPVPLTAKRGEWGYAVDHAKIPAEGGVYVFGRKFGSSFEALYVGKAENIRLRVRQHDNNLRLMQHLHGAKIGKRILLAGVIKMRPGQKLKKAMSYTERALIRHFLAEGDDLVNLSGTRIKRHEINSDGKHPKKYFPRVVFTEKYKGE